MKTINNIIRKVILFSSLPLWGGMGWGLLSSCSDVDIPGFDSLDKVQNLEYTVNNKSVTLTWSAAANAAKYIILQNGVQIAETEATSYTINKVEAGVEQAFTVKAVYADGKVSEGLTAYVTIEPTAITAFYGYIALGDFNSLDDDEQASYNWFKANYVDAGKGAFINAASINSLSADDYSCIMVHVDRVGMGNNVQNLPGEMGGERMLNALRDYVKNGGNLFLSNMASLLVQGIGRIPANCNITVFGDGNGGEGGDIWSACPYQGYQDYGMPDGQCYDHTDHAIYRGLTLDPDLVNVWNFPPGFSLIGPGHREDHNCMWDVNAMGYQGGVNNIKNFEEDQLCSCLATWSHVRDWCVSGITEFYSKDDYKGRIIAIGLAAYEWNQNSGANPYQSNIETIAKNALDYLAE